MYKKGAAAIANEPSSTTTEHNKEIYIVMLIVGAVVGLKLSVLAALIFAVYFVVRKKN